MSDFTDTERLDFLVANQAAVISITVPSLGIAYQVVGFEGKQPNNLSDPFYYYDDPRKAIDAAIKHEKEKNAV